MQRVAKLFIFISVILMLGQTSVFAKTPAVKTTTTTQSCDANGWCNVPLTDTKSFNPACDYRVTIMDDHSKAYVTAAIQVVPEAIGMSVGYGTTTGQVVNAKNKKFLAFAKTGNWWRNNTITTIKISSIQERCKIPNQIPQGQVSLFHLTQCPAGWKLYNPNTMPGATSTLIQCEKE